MFSLNVPKKLVVILTSLGAGLESPALLVVTYKLVISDLEIIFISNLLNFHQNPPLKGALHLLVATEGGPHIF